MRKSFIALPAVLALTGLWAGSAAQAQNAAADPNAATVTIAPAGVVQIAMPFNKAIVRESVPIKLRDFPDDGYISVSIDAQFVTAQALPRRRTDAVYLWDTKAAYTMPNDPNTPKYYNDGAHAVTIAVYDSQSKLVGKDTVQVQVANKINLPASQGIKLAYPWSINTRLTYQRRTLLTVTPADAVASDPGQTLQESLLRYRRTVENASGGRFLLRDEVLPVDKSVRPRPFVSYISTHGGQAVSLQTVALIRPKYREVDKQGHILSDVGEQNGGDQLGFSVPILPPRRISVGAHWETPVQMTFDWTSPYPTTVVATSTLEDFEWQDRYPTAKIRETYTGPATFQPRPGSPLPLLSSQDIKYERIIYFAYNAGRIVRMQTTLSLTTTTPGLMFSAPTGNTSPGMGTPGMGGTPGMSSPGMGMPGMGMPGMNNPGMGMPGQPPMVFPGMSQLPMQPGAPFGQPMPMPGFPSQPQPRPISGQRPRPGSPGSTTTESAPVKLKYTDTSVIIL